MAGIRELKKRLQSVKTTGKLAGAMRTASAAKFARANTCQIKNAPYSEALTGIASSLGGFTEDELCAFANGAPLFEEVSRKKGKKLAEPERGPHDGRPIYLLVSGNRGLCGGYNHELFAYFTELVKHDPSPRAVVCGRKAAEFCRERGFTVLAELPVSDVPRYDEAEALARELARLYVNDGASEVIAVHQRFINMLKHSPESARLLPPEEADETAQTEGGGMLYVPDAETVRAALLPLYFTQQVYTLLLQCASGAQAATLMAMRSAYDNAEAQARSLETEINRRRQAQVTQSVLETSAENGMPQ